MTRPRCEALTPCNRSVQPVPTARELTSVGTRARRQRSLALNSGWTEQQKEVCRRYGAPFSDSPRGLKVGIARNVRDGLMPISGLRHPPEGDTTGWYIWAGEDSSSDPDFFVPLHIEHLAEWCPQALPFLGLPPGWRFLIPGWSRGCVGGREPSECNGTWLSTTSTFCPTLFLRGAQPGGAVRKNIPYSGPKNPSLGRWKPKAGPSDEK